MTIYGLTDEGFEIKPLDAILDELAAEEKARISATLNTEADSVIGQLNGIFAAKLREVWELAGATYAASYPDRATTAALTEIALLTGTRRLAATQTKIYGRVHLSAMTTLVAGNIASVGVGGARFVSQADAVNSSGSAAWIEDVLFLAEDTGPVICNADTLDTIVTASSGWLAVDNADDATTVPNELGTNIESDAALRVRRELELRGPGGNTTATVRAKLLEVADVKAAKLYENISDAADSSSGASIPPHAFEAIIWDGDDTAIANAVWANKPIGINTSGGTSGTATGADGLAHLVHFTRPTVKDVYEIVSVSIDAALFPGDGDAQIKAAVADYGAALSIGDDVILSAQVAKIFAIAGVLDVVSIAADFTASPVPTVNLAIGNREVASLDTSRVGVVHV